MASVAGPYVDSITAAYLRYFFNSSPTTVFQSLCLKEENKKKLRLRRSARTVITHGSTGNAKRKNNPLQTLRETPENFLLQKVSKVEAALHDACAAPRGAFSKRLYARLYNPSSPRDQTFSLPLQPNYCDRSPSLSKCFGVEVFQKLN